MNFFIWILWLPVLFVLSPMSPLFLAVSSGNLFYSCNTHTTGKILSIKNIDSFQCDMNLYLYEFDYNITLNNLSCRDLRKCIRHKHNDKCINATVAINYLNPERCKSLILSGPESRHTHEFDRDWFIGSLISFIFFCLTMIYILFFESRPNSQTFLPV